MNSRRFFWGCLLLWGLLVVLQIVHLSTPQHITDTRVESSVDITIEPGTIHFPQQPVQVTWELEGIQSVHIDGQGTVGMGDTTFIADACTSLTFDVVYADGTEASFLAQPRLSITDPVTVLLVIMGIGVLLLAGRAYQLPILTPIADFISQLPDSYYDPDQSFALWRPALFLAVISASFYSLTPLCHGQTLFDLGEFYPLHLQIFAGTILITLIALLLNLLGRNFLLEIMLFWAGLLPKSIVVGILTVWGGFVFSLIALWGYQLPIVPVLVTLAWFVVIGLWKVQVNILPINEHRSIVAWFTRERLTQHRIPILILTLILGLLLWFAPWQLFIASEWLQMLFGVFLFILPGILVQQWFYRQQAWSLSRALSLGFVLSITMTALLGFISTLLGLSILAVQAGLFLIGFVAFVALLWDGQWTLPPTQTEHPRLVAGLMLIAIFAMLFISRMPFAHFAYNPAFTGDYHTQTAYTTYFAEADTYAYQEIILGTDSPTPPRLWFFYWSLSHAMIGKLSATHASISVLLLGSFTAIIAFTSSYALARRLGMKRALAWLVILIQIASIALTLQLFEVGQVFVQWTAIDKGILTFIFAPVVWSLLLGWLNNPTRGNGILFGLAVIGMPFTHPVMTAITALVCGFMLLFDVVISRRLKTPLIALIILGIAVALPFANLLLATQANSSFAEAVNQPDFTTVQDFHLDLLEFDEAGRYRTATHLVDGLPFILAGVCLVTLWIRTSLSVPARFTLATFIPVGIALFPLTAPLLGRVITPFQLWRVPWIVPFGIVIVLGYQLLDKQLSTRLRPTIIGLLAIACLYVMVTGFQHQHWAISDMEFSREGKSDRPIRQQHVLANLGRYLSDNAQGEVLIIGDPILASWIPTLASQSNGLIFRSTEVMVSQGGIPLTEAEARYEAYLQFFQSEDDQDRLDILTQYDVDYLVISRNQPTILEFATQHADTIQNRGQFGLYTLYQISKP